MSKKTFHLIGINHKKADVSLRSQFSFSEEQKIALLKEAHKKNIHAFIISTCNRTEIFGYCENKEQLVDLYFAHCQGDRGLFMHYSSYAIGSDAVKHLFRLAIGLESQLLGDIEILGQLKADFRLAKKHNTVNGVLERLMNEVVRSSREIRNSTKFNTRHSSISYLAVQWIKTHYSLNSPINILLVGTGKFGETTCNAISKQYSQYTITLVNRTEKKALAIGQKLNLKVASMNHLGDEIAKNDLIILTTNSSTPLINDALIPKERNIAILDLSVPQNISLHDNHPNLTLATLDDLSINMDKTLTVRKKELPLVHTIIQRYYDEFYGWYTDREHAPIVAALKDNLLSIQQNELNYQAKRIENFQTEHAQIVSDRIIHKITTQFITHLKDKSVDSKSSSALIKQIFALNKTVKPE